MIEDSGAASHPFSTSKSPGDGAEAGTDGPSPAFGAEGPGGRLAVDEGLGQTVDEGLGQRVGEGLGQATLARVTRVRAIVEVAVCSGFPTQIAVAAVLAAAGISPGEPGGSLSPTYVFTLVLADAGLLLGLIFWFLRQGGERPSAVLLGNRRLGREALVGLALVPAVYGVAILVLATLFVLAPSLHNVSDNPLEALLRTPAHALMFAFVTIVSGGLREEIQRAFILHRFEQHLGGGLVGIAVFSLIFGLGHTIQGWDVAISTAVLGAMWGLIYLRRRSVVSTVVSHAGFDVAQVFRYTLF